LGTTPDLRENEVVSIQGKRDIRAEHAALLCATVREGTPARVTACAQKRAL